MVDGDVKNMDICDHSDGFTVVKAKGCDWRVLDSVGNGVAYIWGIKCDKILGFVNGYSLACKDDKWGIIDIYGELIEPLRHRDKNACQSILRSLIPINVACLRDSIEDFKNEKGLHGLVLRKEHDKDEILVEPKFKNYLLMRYGLSDATVDWFHYGFIDRTGEFVIPPIYSKAMYFSEGLAAVQVDDLWGYINTKGEFEIEPAYTAAGTFRYGLAAVVDEDGYMGFINRRGETMIPFIYDDMDTEYVTEFPKDEEGYPLALVRLDGKNVYIDVEGNVIKSL